MLIYMFMNTQLVVKGLIKMLVQEMTYPDTDNTVSIFQFWRHIGHIPR
jgi:hypothetical protein